MMQAPLELGGLGSSSSMDSFASWKATMNQLWDELDWNEEDLYVLQWWCTQKEHDHSGYE